MGHRGNHALRVEDLTEANGDDEYLEEEITCFYALSTFQNQLPRRSDRASGPHRSSSPSAVPPTQPSPRSFGSLGKLAGYDPPPSEFWRAPAYVAHVIRRRRVLAALVSAARGGGREHDVASLEAAARAYDAATFAAGATYIAGAITLSAVIVSALIV